MIDDTLCKVAFGQFIRRGREFQHLYQSQVAEQLGVSQQYYSKIESGHRNVDFVQALKICQILHLDLSDFIKEQMK